tara:strand:+ start:995 stop:1147 length:153 start_codon:yes stop_codon:yes gene_type:complete
LNQNSIKPKTIVVKMEIDDQRDKQAAIEKIKFKKSQEVVRREKSLTKKFE